MQVIHLLTIQEHIPKSSTSRHTPPYGALPSLTSHIILPTAHCSLAHGLLSGGKKNPACFYPMACVLNPSSDRNALLPSSTPFVFLLVFHSQVKCHLPRENFSHHSIQYLHFQNIYRIQILLIISTVIQQQVSYFLLGLLQ